MDLKGKTALVTGAAKRIGREIALALGGRGCRVLIHYHSSQAEARDLAEILRSKKCEAELISADLSQTEAVQAMAGKILEDFGAVDLLVNNASAFYPTPMGSVQDKDWDLFLSMHLKAPFFLAQSLAPAMKKKGAGRIVNMADLSGFRPMTGYLPYSVSKGGLISLTKGLAKALAPEVLVNAVCPGAILAPPGFPEKDREKITQKIPVGHWGDPREVARTVVFFAESDYITGQCLVMDGGESLKS